MRFALHFETSKLFTLGTTTRKLLIALAVLAASGAAMAQSSVTLFGIVDATVRTVDAGASGSVWQLTNSGMTGSRLGFRGTEDLGGGLTFWTE